MYQQLIRHENPIFPHSVAYVCLVWRWKYKPQRLFSSIALTVFFIVEAVCTPRVADYSQFSGGGGGGGI
jgi:hypothetical protein